ncbi:MAG TPA: hypothetical protein VFT72_04670 [Opitutaceae bacterium]|nr:hypothetical protein [Opitutaceae bacterium]
MTFARTRFLIAQDLRERAERSGKRYGWISYLKVLFDPPALAVLIFRLQAFVHAKGFRRIATFLRYVNIVCFSIDIGSGAQIDAGFIIYHPNCVAICDECVAGKNLHLVHHNTVMLDPRDVTRDGRIVIEDDIILGCGSRIIGPVKIGANSFIGASAVVTEDVPPFTFFLEPEFTHSEE